MICYITYTGPFIPSTALDFQTSEYIQIHFYESWPIHSTIGETYKVKRIWYNFHLKIQNRLKIPPLVTPDSLYDFPMTTLMGDP